eukprot:jgi/Bigna1/137940/aug1.42_g12648
MESGNRVTKMAIRAALIDLSGTLHIGSKAVSGAQVALKRLRESGVKVAFVTNTTKDSKRALYGKLKAMDFAIDKGEIWSSLEAAKTCILEQKLRPMLLLSDSALEDFKDIDTQDPNSVLVGLAPSKFDYAQLNSAFRLLMEKRGEAKLIAIHKGRYMQKSDGRLSLGPGGFVSALEYASGVEATIIGKPESSFFEKALQRLDAKAEEAVMIGDDVRDDVGGAQGCGLNGILVKTGKYREGDESRHGVKPWYLAKDFPAAVDAILRENGVSDQRH